MLANESDLSRMKFQNYIKEIYVDSDTKIALLSGAPFDDNAARLLSNEQIADARAVVNRIAGSRRMLAHSIVRPGQDGWMDEVDHAIEVLHPESWKGYTVGDPVAPTRKHTNWRLDDEKVVYPFYEKAVKAGITNICIHKGLLPADYATSWPEIWQYATAWDVGKAAKDWPQLNFVIYHAAMRPFLEVPDATLKQFDETGRIDWATDLAEIPGELGVKNVYADLGTCFANCCVTHPQLAAALLGTLIKGLGQDRVLWGTDSVWYGSPQWQIEALRRLEIPEDMQRKHGFKPLGAADGPVKSAIFAGNAARMYRLDTRNLRGSVDADQIAAMKVAYQASGGERSNLRYGYVVPAAAAQNTV
jgi:predicted TIM-barrel fold metal-dependent hydrolase